MEKALFRKVIYMYFLQINWLNVIIPKSPQRQKAVILVTLPQARCESLGLHRTFKRGKCQSNCWLIDACYPVGSISMKRKINSSFFNEPVLNMYDVLGAVVAGAFSLTLLSE